SLKGLSGNRFGNQNAPHGDSSLGIDGLCSPSQRCSLSRDGDAFTPVRWHDRPHPLGKGSHCRNQSARPSALGRAYGSIHNLDYCLAHFANSALGGVLSLALSTLMGSWLLFLGCLLFYGW